MRHIYEAVHFLVKECKVPPLFMLLRCFANYEAVYKSGDSTFMGRSNSWTFQRLPPHSRGIIEIDNSIALYDLLIYTGLGSDLCSYTRPVMYNLLLPKGRKWTLLLVLGHPLGWKFFH